MSLLNGRLFNCCGIEKTSCRNFELLPQHTSLTPLIVLKVVLADAIIGSCEPLFQNLTFAEDVCSKAVH